MIARTIKYNRLSVKLSGSLFWYCLLALFYVTKVIRGMVSSSTEAGGVWNYISFIFIAYGAVAFIRVYHKSAYQNTVMNFLLFFTLLSFIFSIVNIRTISVSTIYNIVVILFPYMIMCVFYYLGVKYGLFAQKKILQITFFVITVIVVIQTASVRASGIRQVGRAVAVADVYYTLTLLPLMLVFFSPKASIGAIVLAFIAILLTGKRTGLLAIVLMLMVYYFVLARQQNRLTSYLKIFVLLLVVGLILYFAANYLDSRYNLNVISRLERLSEDGGSGRDVRWENVWAVIRKSGFFDIVFGRGDNSIVQSVGGHAHNDFLEVLHDYGIVSFILYVAFYISLFRLGFAMIRKRYPYAAHFLCSVIISLILANFSFFVIEPTYITGSMVTIGLLLADWQGYMERNRKRVYEPFDT